MSSEGGDGVNPNERIAILLGWRRARSQRWMPPGSGPIAFRSTTFDHPPDFTDWARFPDLQAYAADMDGERRSALARSLLVSLGYQYGPSPWPGAIFDITPTILRDAILEAVGEEA